MIVVGGSVIGLKDPPVFGFQRGWHLSYSSEHVFLAYLAIGKPTPSHQTGQKDFFGRSFKALVGELMRLPVAHRAEQLPLLGKTVHEKSEDVRCQRVRHTGTRFDPSFLTDGRTNAGELAYVVWHNDSTRIQHSNYPLGDAPTPKQTAFFGYQNQAGAALTSLKGRRNFGAFWARGR